MNRQINIYKYKVTCNTLSKMIDSQIIKIWSVFLALASFFWGSFPSWRLGRQSQATVYTDGADGKVSGYKLQLLWPETAVLTFKSNHIFHRTAKLLLSYWEPLDSTSYFHLPNSLIYTSFQKCNKMKDEDYVE